MDDPNYIVSGAGGGGKSGDTTTHTPTEAPDTLFSNSIAHVVDLLSEGPIEGFVNGDCSVYFNETPLKSSTGTYNFTGATIVHNVGNPKQPALPGFDSARTTIAVGQELPYNVYKTISFPNDGTFTAVEITIGTSGGFYKVEDDGDVVGTDVTFTVEKSENGGSWVVVANPVITGKQRDDFNRDYHIPISDTGGNTAIRVKRTKADSATLKLADAIVFRTYTKIVEHKLTYPNCAVVGSTFDAKPFGNSIPQRAYHVRGLKIKVPHNYNPLTRVYTGTFNGSLSSTAQWSSNPAWVFYDLVTNERYGLGQFLDPGLIDIPTLYTIGKWCDDMVSDGRAARSVSSITRSGSTVTVTTVASHGWSSGKYVLIAGASQTQYNGNWYITVTGPKTFTFNIGALTPATPATGTITAQGREPRWSCNTQIIDRGDAFNVLRELVSCFRGVMFWMDGRLWAQADMPRDPVKLVTNANVVGGVFTYSGESNRDRRSVINVSWNDPDIFYRRAIEVYEDPELIAEIGWKTADYGAFGCTSRAQARRLAKAILYSQENESELVTYRASFDHMATDGDDGPTGIAPGDVILIADQERGNAVAAGRITTVTAANEFTYASDTIIAPGTGTVYLEHHKTGTVEYVPCRYTSSTLGAERVVNGVFTTDTSGWAATNSATLSVVANALRVTSTGVIYGSAKQVFPIEVGKRYQFTFDHKVSTASKIIQVWDSSGSGPKLQYQLGASSSGTVTGTFTATTNTEHFIILGIDATANYCEYDNVSIREVGNSDSGTVILTGTPAEAIDENDLYIVIAGGYDAETFRVLKIAQTDEHLYDITAVRYNEGKFAAIYDEHQFEDANVMRINRVNSVPAPGTVVADPGYVAGIDRQRRTLEIRWLPRATKGTNLVTNGDFPTATTGWTASGATLSIVSAALRVTNSGAAKGYAYQALTTEVGTDYGILFKATPGTGPAKILVGSAPGLGDYSTATGSGRNKEITTFTALATTTYVSLYTDSATSGHYSTYDNIECYSLETGSTLHSHYRVSYSYNNDGWHELSPAPGTATRIDNVRPGTYKIAVQSVAANGTISTSSTQEVVVDTVPGSEMPTGNITNLVLEYHGKDVKVKWNTQTSRDAYFAAKGLTVNTGVPDPTFRDYLVTIKKTSDSSVLRTEPVTGNSYTYTYENNAIDSGGTATATKALTFEVSYRDTYGRASTPATLAADNVAPAVPTSLSVTPVPAANLIKWTKAADTDLAVSKVYAHTSNVVGSATLIAATSNEFFLHSGLTVGATWYYWVSSVDCWGNESTKTAAGNTTVLSMAAFDSALVGIGDDNVLDIKEKQSILIPRAADLEARYTDLRARAVTLGLSTTALDTARTNWKNQLAVYSPAWNDTTAPTTVLTPWWPPKEWTTGWTTSNVSTSTNGAYRTVDDSGGSLGYISRSQAQTAAATTYSAGVLVKKTTSGSHIMRLELQATGGTAKTAGANFKANGGTTGGTSNTTANGVLDLGDEWFFYITFTTNADNTNVAFVIYPAFNTTIGSTTSSAATTGTADIRTPTIVVGAASALGISYLTGLFNAYIGAMTTLLASISNTDGTTGLYIQSIPDTIIAADSTGTIVSGELPEDVNFKSYVGTASVTTSSTWSVNTVTGVTASIGAATGTLTITALTTQSATLTITCTYNGVSRLYQHRILRQDDAATLPSGGGGGGGSVSSTTTLGNTTGTSYDTTNAVSATLTAIPDATGSVTCVAPITFKRTSTSTTGFTGAAGKWQWRISGGSFADIAAEVADSGDASRELDPEAGGYVTNAGSLNVTQTKTGLTNGSTYEFRFVWRDVSVSGTASRIYRTAGTLTATVN